jgi:hypothetical protein
MQPPLVTSTSPAIVCAHVTCARCGYDLHSLRRSANCPECAYSIEVSLQEYALRDRTDPPLEQVPVTWLRILAAGLNALFIATAFAVIAGWLGIKSRWEGFGYALFAVPPWVIACYGVWKLTTREPHRRRRTRGVERWGNRFIAIFFVILPLFMIRPGYLRFGDLVWSETWCPVCDEALVVGVLSPIASALLALRCAHLAGRTKLPAVRVQLLLLPAFWVPAMVFTGWDALGNYHRYYSPLIWYYDVGGAAGVGRVGLLAPVLAQLSPNNALFVIDGILSIWFLVLLVGLRAGILRASDRVTEHQLPDRVPV